MNWLRSLLKMFYAPGRALSEVRDHTPFAVAAILSLSVNGVYLFVVQQDILSRVLNLRGLFAFISVFFESAGMTLLIALVYVPLLIFFANIFNRSASYRLVLQQEYASTASTVLYTWAASGLVSLFLFLLARMSGLQASLGQEMLKLYLQQQKELPPSTLTQIDPRMLNPEIFAAALSLLLMWALFVGWAVV